MTKEGKAVQVNGTNLHTSTDLKHPEMVRLLRDVTQEYFQASYREKLPDGEKNVLQIVGARLLKERVWFLIYESHVVLMADGSFKAG